jgi:hypothetical protein
MLRTFDRIAGSMYLSEVRDLLDSTLFRIQAMEKAQAAWVENDKVASAQIAAAADDFSLDAFNQALRGTSVQNRELFDALESFFAAWARLSLLFYPVRTKGEVGGWRKTRGQQLRALFDLPEESLLSNRDFRDSWMHFDERLDQAWLGHWLGNRQQFVRSAIVPTAIDHSVRVIDVEGLVFHYRTEGGALASITVSELKSFLQTLESELPNVGPRIVRSLPAPG